MESGHTAQRHEAWNKGKLVGQKAPFKLKEIWAIRKANAPAHGWALTGQDRS